jgi:hypothetical protein
LSGLDKKGSKFPNGINVPNNKMFIDDTAITATAAEINRGALKKVTGPLGTASGQVVAYLRGRIPKAGLYWCSIL